MIKKLIVAVAALVVGVIIVSVCGGGWCFFGEFSKDAAVAKVVRMQNKELQNAEAEVEAFDKRVQNAESWLNKINILIERTKEHKAEADSICTDCQQQLQFIKSRTEENKPVSYTDGSELTDQEINYEVERIGYRLEAAREASKGYGEELDVLNKDYKQYAEWATSGESRREALRLKLENTRQLFNSQAERLKLLNDDECSRDLKKAYKQALGSIKKAKAELGLNSGIEERNINFDDKAVDEISEKTKLRLQKIDALLGNSSNEVNESRVSFK